jgi:hypothetical protein
MIAELCGVKGECVEVIAPPSAARIRELVVAHEGFGLVEPDLPIGKLALPREPIDRAILAVVTRGRPRSLLFVRGISAKLAKVKDERVLDFTVTLVDEMPSGHPLVEAALAILRERGPTPGKTLLREARAALGSANTRDSADLGRALIRAWNAGAIELG